MMNFKDELKQELSTRKRKVLSRKYFCEKCEYSGPSQFHLKRHSIAYHERLNKCDFRAPWPAGLILHKRVKHGGIKFNCDLCSTKCSYDYNLKSHIDNKHKGIKYACDQCDHKASTIWSLATHKKGKHEKVKYDCNQCNHKASHRSALKVT